MKPLIIAKSFPTKEQIQGRINSRAFDGIELFIMDNILENQQHYEDIVKLATDNLPVVNFETFYGIKINGLTKTTSVIDSRQDVREKSRKLLEAAINLNQERGTINTHFASIPIYLDETHSPLPTIPTIPEQIQMFGEYLQQFKNQGVIAENIIAYDTTIPEQMAAAYCAGLVIDDFVKLFSEFGIKMNLDTAHLAISLQQYSYNLQGRKFLTRDGKQTDPSPIFKQREHDLGAMVMQDGLMPVWLNQVNKLPIGSIGNVHFINGIAAQDGSFKDGFVEFEQNNEKLLDLNQALNYLQSRSDVEQIVPEVVDGLYAKNPDYNSAPKMAEMARILREKLNK